MPSVRGVKYGAQKHCVGLHKCVAPSGAYARNADLSNVEQPGFSFEPINMHYDVLWWWEVWSVGWRMVNPVKSPRRWIQT